MLIFLIFTALFFSALIVYSEIMPSDLTFCLIRNTESAKPLSLPQMCPGCILPFTTKITYHLRVRLQRQESKHVYIYLTSLNETLKCQTSVSCLQEFARARALKYPHLKTTRFLLKGDNSHFERFRAVGVEGRFHHAVVSVSLLLQSGLVRQCHPLLVLLLSADMQYVDATYRRPTTC